MSTLTLWDGPDPSAPTDFSIPWHRHLQWYLSESPVLLLVPEEGFALVGERDGPFIREERRIERMEEDFYALTVPFRGELRAGSLVLTARRERIAA